MCEWSDDFPGIVALSTLSIAGQPPANCELPLPSDLLHVVQVTNLTGGELWVTVEVSVDGPYLSLKSKGHTGPTPTPESKSSKQVRIPCYTLGKNKKADATKTASKRPVYVRPHKAGESYPPGEDLTISLVWSQCYRGAEITKGTITHPVTIIQA